MNVGDKAWTVIDYGGGWNTSLVTGTIVAVGPEYVALKRDDYTRFEVTEVDRVVVGIPPYREGEGHLDLVFRCENLLPVHKKARKRQYEKLKLEFGEE